MIIGLSGKACAGKNKAAEILSKKGCKAIDVDTLGHDVLVEQTDKISDVFGSKYIIKNDEGNNGVDRKALGKLVFSNPQALKKLEEITHPLIKKKVLELCDKYYASGYQRIIINAAILHKMKMETYLDAVIWIDAGLLKRIKRSLSRDNISLLTVIKRICTQRKLNTKCFNNCVDMYKVGNNAGIKPLERSLEAVLKEIEQRKIDGR